MSLTRNRPARTKVAMIIGILVMTWFLPQPLLALQFEKPSDTQVGARGNGELVLLDGARFAVWMVQSEGAALSYSSVPNEYRGQFSSIDPGASISEELAMKVIDAHFKEVAFDYDSIKIRKFAVTSSRFVVTCNNLTLFGCGERQFHAGTVVEFESNGTNRLGGMTGYEAQTFVLTRLPDNGAEKTTELTATLGGRVPVKTADQLNAALVHAATIATDKPAADVLLAIEATLVQQGFAVGTKDERAGIVATVPRQYKLTSATVDCGKAFGIPFISDHRTETTILLSFKVSDGSVEARTAIDGIQRIKSMIGIMDNGLTCTSNGKVEQDIVLKALASLP